LRDSATSSDLLDPPPTCLDRPDLPRPRPA